MITRTFDVIVAGLRPGGLLAGALLARRGMRVLVIGQNEESPVQIGRYTFPSHNYPIVGFEDPEMLGGVLAELNIHPSTLQGLCADVPSLQVILPGQRVDIYPDERLREEVSREFRNEEVQLEALYERVRHEAGAFIAAYQQRRSTPWRPSFAQHLGFGGLLAPSDRALFSSSTSTLGEIFEEIEASTALRAFVCAQITTLGGLLSAEALPMPIAAHLLLAGRTGVYTSRDRVEPLKDILFERLKNLHADIRLEERIVGVEPARRRIQALRFLGHEQLFTCEYLLWNTSYRGFLQVLPDSLRKRGYEGRYPEAEHEWMSVHLAIDEKVVPVGMKDQAIIVADDEAPFTDGNLVWVGLSPEDAESYAPGGTRSLTASTIVHAEPKRRTREGRREIATKVLTHLKHVMPFLEPHVRALHVPVPAHEEEGSLPVVDANVQLRAVPGDMGPGPRMPHFNVFHLGMEAYPLLGFDGELCSAVLTAESILAAHKGNGHNN